MQKIYVILASFLLLAYLGYSIFISPVDTSSTSFSGNPAVGQDVLDLIAKMRNISFDQTFFSEPLFTSLKDSTVPLQPEAQGRSNPFLPIGTDR